MSRKASLSALPVEMLHRVFDELDGRTIFLAMRDVCQSLRAIVDNYHRRYALDFTSLCKSDFHRLLFVIRPEYVIGLTLSDEETTTPGQIGAFLSLVDISHFTRLRSLTLLHIEQKDLCRFLEHVTRLTTLTSLTVRSRFHFYLEEPQLVEHLSSIIGQPTLRRLELLDAKLSHLANQCQCPMKYRFQHLTMTCYLGQPSGELIALSPDLTTLVLDEKSSRLTSLQYECGQWFSTPCRRLTSLTLLNFSLQMTQMQSILSETPSLRHLAIVTRSRYMIDGSRWEEIIKTKLPFLQKFEFYTRFSRYRPRDETEKSVFNEMITPFCSPFWTEEKRWLVTCNFFPTARAVEIYTSPIYISAYRHTSDPKMKAISNFERKDQHSTVLETVDALQVNPYTILDDEHVSDLSISQEFVGFCEEV